MNGPKFIERNIGPNISLRDVTSALCESVYSKGSFGGFYQHVLELSKTLDIFIDSTPRSSHNKSVILFSDQILILQRGLLWRHNLTFPNPPKLFSIILFTYFLVYCYFPTRTQIHCHLVHLGYPGAEHVLKKYLMREWITTYNQRKKIKTMTVHRI